MRLENRSNCSRQELCDSELFWNRIMMEHALFIRSLLDPSEEALVGSAGYFAADYKRLLEASAAANDKVMNGSSLALTQKFRDFKRASVDGIASCKIRSIILPPGRPRPPGGQPLSPPAGVLRPRAGASPMG